MSDTSLHGSCHCGNLSVVLDVAQAHGQLQPRACDCSFCRKHGAVWVSDNAGRLRVEASDSDGVNHYRQGSKTARFVLCAHCGVLAAVVYEMDDDLLGAINAKCLDDGFTLGKPVAASAQRLSAQEKVERWRALWVRDVIVPSECSSAC